VSAYALTACAALAAAAAVAAAGCGGGTARPVVAGGDAANGQRLIEHYGCGACHVIAGITPQGHVGPSLRAFASDRRIADTLPNTVANVVRWIRNPQRVRPGTDMPVLGLGERGARDVAAYLYGQ